MRDIDNTKRYQAKVHSITMADDESVEVVSSTDTPDSSYGLQHWVDKNGNSYGQIDLINPLYHVFDIEETTEEEADRGR